MCSLLNPRAHLVPVPRHLLPQGQQPPPVSFLRHPRVFDVLLHGLFSPGRQLQPEVVQAYSGLLALAAAADDRRPCGPADGSGGAQPPDDLLDVSGVAATRAALEAAAELAQHVLQDQKSSAEELERAAAVMEYPCCAAGEPTGRQAAAGPAVALGACQLARLWPPATYTHACSLRPWLEASRLLRSCLPHLTHAHTHARTWSPNATATPCPQACCAP